jgi:hypothetical protein
MDSIKATCVVSAVVIAVLFVGTHFLSRQPTKSPPAPIPGPVINYAPGTEPWAASERSQKYVRESARKTALTALDGPWSAFCNAGESKIAYGSVRYYFEQRGMHETGYPLSFGEAGRRFIIEAYHSSDDQRIERMLRMIYHAGYFKLDRLPARHRVVARKILGDEKPGEDACAS